MPSLTIKKLPDRILRKKCGNIAGVTQREREILADMLKTMYLNSGVGLAGPQVGISRQLAVVDIGNGPINIINPVIVKKDGANVQDEGCLSIPGISVSVKRAKKITVIFLNEEGRPVQIRAEGLLARAIQHEIDHLNGKLIVDYLNPIKRLMLKRHKFS